MKSTIISLGLVASAALCLSGCAINASTLAASQGLVDSLAKAGCKGSLHVGASATTAAAGVPSANITNTFDGTCDPSTAVTKTAAAQ